MFHTTCMYNSNIGIHTIIDEFKFVVIILLLMADIDRNKKRNTEIILIYTENFAERKCTADELSFQQWYATDNGNNNTDNNSDTFDNVSFNSDDQICGTINNILMNFITWV